MNPFVADLALLNESHICRTNQEEFMLARILPANEGVLDRTLRIIVGAALLSLVFVGPKTTWGLLGIIPLATGALGSCPVYTLLGMNTCSMKQR